MSDASGWYQRAMQRARGAEPQQQQQQRPTYISNVQPYQNQTPVRQQPQPQPQQQGPPPSSQKFAEVTTSQLLHLQTATGEATPGIGAQLNPNPCPNCGASLFYEQFTKQKRRGPEPAPHCFSCGYNGLFEQGLQSSWAG